MTTVIMISNDNSVIITNNDTPETSPVKNHLCSPDSGSGSSVDSPVLRGVQPKPGQNRKSYQSRKLSVSTVESDSEELNHSSSSTTSTLSSRTSGVSSGATSGSSGTNLSYPALTSPVRKFTTLNRQSHQPKIKPNPVLRTRSFQVSHPKLSQFSPSENSAFHCISANSRDLSQAAKFVTSTPVKSVTGRETGRDNGVRQTRRSQHMKNVFTPAAAPLSTFSPGGDQDRHGPHTSDYYSATRSLGRQPRGSGHVSTGSTRVAAHDPELSQHPAFRHLMPPPTSSSNVKMRPRLGQCDETPINCHYTRIYSGSGVTRDRGYSDNNNDNDLTEIYRDPVSSDSDYDTIYSNKEDNNTLLPIGSVFPSGCHRHPSKLMSHRPTISGSGYHHPHHVSKYSNSGHYQYTSHQAPIMSSSGHHAPLSSSVSAAQLLSYRHNLDACHSENSTLNRFDISHRLSQNYPSLSENSSETDSISRKDKPRRLPDFINKSEMAAKAKSFDGLAALLNKTSFKENKENNKSKISFNESIVPRRQKLRISQATGAGGNKFSGLSVSKAQILRRHTLHDKSNIRQSLQNVHVHSWHKQDDEQQRSKSSSLKRSVSRRSSSSSRLSLLSRRDDVEISITDSQSLDRLSLHSQEDLDDINIEKYLQTAGRAAGWAKDFDCLLSDKIGLAKFTEFLQKEFSHENIFFWSACEKYKMLEAGADRLKLAQEIIQRHLELGATEPVNVDSVARAATRHKVAMASVQVPPETNVFMSAQRQIYNLMKFDSYPRFLKSDVYKDCIRAEMSGAGTSHAVSEQNLVSQDTAVAQNLVTNNREEYFRQRRTDSLKTKRRKSMSFWEHWSQKSRDHLDTETGNGTILTRDSTPPRDRGGCTLTRVIFPDLATTVVSTTTGESIRALISRLLDKRNLRLTSFDVFVTNSEAKPLDLSEDCGILHCTEVRVESRVLFRLELPSHKSIGVKAKQTKTVSEVLAPILLQYGWNINEVDVYVDEDTTIAGAGDDKVDLVSNVGVIDNKRLFVVQKSHEEIQKAENNNTENNKASSGDPDSSEMTLYEGLQIMRKGRFEDQRGTEICFEIPEFLRLPENSLSPCVAEDIQDRLTQS